MPDISKIILPGSTTPYDIKDAYARTTISQLKSAAFVDTTTAIAGSTIVLPTDYAVKTYVDAEIAKIDKFDIHVCTDDASDIPAGAIYYDGTKTVEGTLVASEDTRWLVYLVRNENISAGSYAEYITVRTGSEGAYAYLWELIGTTKADLKDYLTTTASVAGVQFGSDKAISAEELSAEGALNLKTLAHKDSGTYDKVSSIEMNAVTVSGSSTVTFTDTTASIQYEDYTPQGSVTSNAIVDGSISVTVKDASSTTEASLTSETVNIVNSLTTESTDFVKTASFAADENGVAVTGTISAPTISVTQSTASVRVADNEGTSYSITDGSVVKAADTTANFVKKAFNFSMGTGADEEMLTISEVSSDDTTFFTTAVTAAGGITYIAPVLSGSLPTFKDQTVASDVATATADAPVFTGGKFGVTVTTANAINTVNTTAGTFNNVTKAEYLKQEIDTATFTKSTIAPTVEFTGTAASIKASTVTYKKADATAEFSTSVTPTVKTINTTTTNVTFS